MNQKAVTAKSSIYLNTMPATKESHKSSSFELCHLCLLILAISLSLIIHLSYYWSQQSFRIQQIFYFFSRIHKCILGNHNITLAISRRYQFVMLIFLGQQIF